MSDLFEFRLLLVALKLRARKLVRASLGKTYLDHWIRFWQPLALCLFIILMNPWNQSLSFRLFFPLLGYAVLAATLGKLMGGRMAITIPTVFAGLVFLMTTLHDPGAYNLVYPSHGSIDRNQSIKVSIPTFHNSPKWKTINKDTAVPYLFLAVIGRPLEHGEMRVKVGEIEYGDVTKIPGMSYGNMRYTFPIPWDVLERTDVVDVIMDITPRERLYFEREASRPLKGRMPRQFLLKDNSWQPILSEFGSPIRYVVEIRIGNKSGHTLGILY